MANRIELSFSTNPTAPPHASSAGDIDQQDMWTPAAETDASATRKNNEEILEQIPIGERTVGEVVRGLGRVLGNDLYPSRIVQSDPYTTRVFLEQGQPSTCHTKESNDMLDGGTKESNNIYDITEGGKINTTSVRTPGTTPREEDHFFVEFQRNFAKTPSILVGLNYLDQPNRPTIFGNLELVHDDLFYLRTVGFSDTRGVGYTWLAVPSYEHPLLQVGKVTFESDRGNPILVTFNPPYDVPPKVVVWLKDIYGVYHIKVSAERITATGFEVHIKTLLGSGYGLSISWFAYPVNTPGICSGHLGRAAGVIRFDTPFTSPPRRILVAFSELGSGHGDCRCKITHELVSATRMAVRVDSWGNTKLSGVGIAYIAMQ